MQSSFIQYILISLLLCASISAQTAEEIAAGLSPAEIQIHNELRNLRDEMLDALNKADLTRLLDNVHSEIVFTGMNGEVARGKQEVRAYFQKMMAGENRIVESITIDLTVDTLSILHGGDTAIAYGSSRDVYSLTEGLDFEAQTRWTATMVKSGGRWFVAAFHSSANIFENAILSKTRTSLIIAVIASALLGLALGAGAMAWFKRR
jgi:uncharacterized protein (TIGR02246 family)